MVQFVAKLVQTERNTKRKRIFFVLKGQQRIAQGKPWGNKKDIGTIDYSIYGIRGGYAVCGT